MRSRLAWGALTILRTGNILLSGQRVLQRRRRPSRRRAGCGAGRGGSVRAERHAGRWHTRGTVIARSVG